MLPFLSQSHVSEISSSSGLGFSRSRRFSLLRPDWFQRLVLLLTLAAVASGPHELARRAFTGPAAKKSQIHSEPAGVVDAKFSKLISCLDVLPESKEVQTMYSALHTAKQDFERPTMIMFVGAYSAGKSALINSLLKEEVCKTGIRPTTSDLDFHQWDGMLLVDSAGLDAMNKPEQKEKALEAARRSNVAVVVVNARQPLRESEGDILRELLEANSKVVVAINYWNHVQKEEERKDCKKYVEEMLTDLMPGKRPPLFCVDASSSGDKGVKQLRKHLQSDDLQGGSQKVISATTAMLQGAKRMLQLHQNCYEALQKELEDITQTLLSMNRSIEMEDEHLKKLETKRGHSGLWRSVAKGAFVGFLVDAATRFRSRGAGIIAGALVSAMTGRPSAEAREELEKDISGAMQKIRHLEGERLPGFA